MTLNNAETLEEELTCRFKIEMRNLTNFDPSTQKSQNFSLPFEQNIYCLS